MSVYTQITLEEAAAFTRHYQGVGEPTDLQGIHAGIENTNYFLTASGGRFVLTIFEKTKPSRLPYCLSVMALYAEHGIPCARPVPRHDSSYLGELKDKPAALVTRLPGESPEGVPTINQCRLLGHYLAKMHRLAKELKMHQKPEREHRWWRQTADSVLSSLPLPDQKLLEEELAFQSDNDFTQAPGGAIHADLFRDNVLFEKETLSGILDFYYACDWPFVYDLAVVVNDWCFIPGQGWDEERLRALLDAYQKERPIGETERMVWPGVLRAAALRFWLSRLNDKLFPRAGELTHIKDPDQMREILIANSESGNKAAEALFNLPLKQKQSS